jgi:hypothetical protein
VDVALDEARQHRRTGCIEHPGSKWRFAVSRNDLRDPSVADDHIGTQPLVIALHGDHETAAHTEIGAHPGIVQGV